MQLSINITGTATEDFILAGSASFLLCNKLFLTFSMSFFVDT